MMLPLLCILILVNSFIGIECRKRAKRLYEGFSVDRLDRLIKKFPLPLILTLFASVQIIGITVVLIMRNAGNFTPNLLLSLTTSFCVLTAWMALYYNAIFHSLMYENNQ